MSAAGPKRVLVTGAGGFLGRALTRALVQAGHFVTGLVRRPIDIPPNDRLRWVQGDIADLNLLAPLVEQSDAVCHLAAFIPSNQEDLAQARTCMEVNALATLHLADLVAQKSGRRLVYLSGSNAYAQPRESAALAESHALYPCGFASYYLTSKVAGEVFVEHLRMTRGLEAISLRVSTPYGPGMPAKSVVHRFMTNAIAGLPLEVWDGGLSTFDFVYVDDVIEVIVNAVGSGPAGIYNVGSGVATSLLDLARAVADAFPERKIPIDVRPPSNPPALRPNFPAIDPSKILGMWSLKPRPLAGGLADFRAYLEKNPTP